MREAKLPTSRLQLRRTIGVDVAWMNQSQEFIERLFTPHLTLGWYGVGHDKASGDVEDGDRS